MPERAWYRSLYWRIAFGFVCFLGLTLVIQASLFLVVVVRAERDVSVPALEAFASTVANGVAAEIEAFAANTLDYIKHEYPLLIDGVGIQPLRTKLDGRDALVLARGYHHREDLATLRSYIRERRPATCSSRCTASIATLMMSAAEPWMGALSAIRSAISRRCRLSEVRSGR
jgi:hypothetical protein